MTEQHTYQVTRARRPDYQPTKSDPWGIAWDATSHEPHPGYAEFDHQGRLMNSKTKPDIKENEMTALKVAEWALKQDGEHTVISQHELKKLKSQPNISGKQHLVWVLTMKWHYGTEEEWFSTLEEAKNRRTQWISVFGDVFCDWKIQKQVRFDQDLVDFNDSPDAINK